MNKIELWKKYELFELHKDLEIAEKILMNFSCADTRKFTLAKEFHLNLEDEIFNVKYDNLPDFNQIIQWFSSDSIWCELTGIQHIDLGNRIYSRAKKWNTDNIKATSKPFFYNCKMLKNFFNK